MLHLGELSAFKDRESCPLGGCVEPKLFQVVVKVQVYISVPALKVVRVGFQALQLGHRLERSLDDPPVALLVLLIVVLDQLQGVHVFQLVELLEQLFLLWQVSDG
jgi:hypothetical protein